MCGGKEGVGGLCVVGRREVRDCVWWEGGRWGTVCGGKEGGEGLWVVFFE